MLNVHPSLLPRWRGAAPIERAIMAGDEETGVTIMRVTAGLDSGPIALRRRCRSSTGEDFGDLEPRLAELGGELLVRAFDLRAAGSSSSRSRTSRGTYAEKIAAEDRRLDPARPATELERPVRALNPHIGTYLQLDGDERLGVRRAEATQGELEPGTLRGDDGELVLGTGEGDPAAARGPAARASPMPAERVSARSRRLPPARFDLTRRAAPPSRSCAGSSRTAPGRTARCRRRSAATGSPSASAASRSGSPTARSSGAAPPTT